MRHTPNDQQRVLKDLSLWAKNKAREKGVPEYMILPHTTINFIAQALPQNSEELLLVKGIKESKLREYGEDILGIIAGEVTNTPIPEGQPAVAATDKVPDALPVGAYLNLINRILSQASSIRVIGEVGQVKEQGNAVYFTLKDEKDGSNMSIFMWKNAYHMSGVELSEGMRVILSGTSEVYKPTGRLSFRADTLELVGEGALKAAYEKLKKKLFDEGLFDPDKKKGLPLAPRRIGLITSRSGAVIHDFLNNLDRRGMTTYFIDSRVEGVLAIGDVLAGIATLRNKEIDILVLIRGGGSLESLQAFNNEHIVRALHDFPVPVICAIGHHEDVPLAQLTADLAPSTPTACAVAINDRWNILDMEIERSQQKIFPVYERLLIEARRQSDLATLRVMSFSEKISQLVRSQHEEVKRMVDVIAASIRSTHTQMETITRTVVLRMNDSIRNAKTEIGNITRTIRSNDPRRLLESGYAFALREGKLLRSISDAPLNARFQLHVSDGTIDASVIGSTPTHEKDQ